MFILVIDIMPIIIVYNLCLPFFDKLKRCDKTSTTHIYIYAHIGVKAK